LSATTDGAHCRVRDFCPLGRSLNRPVLLVVAEFPWSYESQEVCYILEGKATVTPDGGEPVEIEKGDIVTFPKGMSCRWNIKEGIRKHHDFQ